MSEPDPALVKKWATATADEIIADLRSVVEARCAEAVDIAKDVARAVYPGGPIDRWFVHRWRRDRIRAAARARKQRRGWA